MIDKVKGGKAAWYPWGKIGLGSERRKSLFVFIHNSRIDANLTMYLLGVGDV